MVGIREHKLLTRFVCILERDTFQSAIRCDGDICGCVNDTMGSVNPTDASERRF